MFLSESSIVQLCRRLKEPDVLFGRSDMSEAMVILLGTVNHYHVESSIFTVREFDTFTAIPRSFRSSLFNNIFAEIHQIRSHQVGLWSYIWRLNIDSNLRKIYFKN